MSASAVVGGGGVQTHYSNKNELQLGIAGAASALSSGTVKQSAFSYKRLEFTITKNKPTDNGDSTSFTFTHRRLPSAASFHHSGSCSNEADVNPSTWNNRCQKYKCLGFLHKCTKQAIKLVSFLNLGQHMHSFSENLKSRANDRADVRDVESMFLKAFREADSTTNWR